MEREPKTLQQAIQYFSDFENCQKFMIELRWPDGNVRCPQCGSEKVAYLENARLYKCYGKHERPKFSLKVGTLFEDSAIGLDKWFAAMWLVVNCKNGVSSYEVGRDLGVSQKSAWHMLHRIRFALHRGSFEKLSGEVEVDETFIGGKARNMHKDKRRVVISRPGPHDKVPVMGMVERETGKVIAFPLNNRRKPEIQKHVRDHVKAGAAIFTDELKSYEGLNEFQHEVVNHAVAYVRDNVHTNKMENFWSLLKRGLHGTYISVEPFHLFRYIDEQMFCYNNRENLNDFDRFKLAASQIVGKRLTWNQVTGKQPDPQTAVN